MFLFCRNKIPFTCFVMISNKILIPFLIREMLQNGILLVFCFNQSGKIPMKCLAISSCFVFCEISLFMKNGNPIYEQQAVAARLCWGGGMSLRGGGRASCMN